MSRRTQAERDARRERELVEMEAERIRRDEEAMESAVEAVNTLRPVVDLDDILQRLEAAEKEIEQLKKSERIRGMFQP